MGQEFFIKSDRLESEVRKLLPSQGGLGAGVDLSASTQIVPIIDLTETAEGSTVRPDLQTALSLNDVTVYNVSNTTSTVINNTGYFRVFGNLTVLNPGGSTLTAKFTLTDGVASKILKNITIEAPSAVAFLQEYDFTVFINAGQSMTATTNSAQLSLTGVTKQIASIDGELTQPS